VRRASLFESTLIRLGPFSRYIAITHSGVTPGDAYRRRFERAPDCHLTRSGQSTARSDALRRARDDRDLAGEAVC
jgi:hypothetical protein